MPYSTSEPQKVFIRKAVEKDAAAIVQVHHGAVHETAAKDYSQTILDEWSNLAADRIERLETQIRNNPESTYMVVAEMAGQVVGFGEIVPNKNELRAVYVSPAAGRQGVGKALLEALEAEARQQGVTQLHLDSSVTAQLFYLAHGYLSDSQGQHQLRSGQKMTCIKMHKDLSK